MTDQCFFQCPVKLFHIIAGMMLVETTTAYGPVDQLHTAILRLAVRAKIRQDLLFHLRQAPSNRWAKAIGIGMHSSFRWWRPKTMLDRQP